MKVKQLHPNLKLPTRATQYSAGYDVYMPEAGELSPYNEQAKFVGLGFAAAVPHGYVALLLPRSGAGAKKGLALNNTVGVIDEDYRGEWMAALRLNNAMPMKWAAGDALLQIVLVPVGHFTVELVDELPPTQRGTGGFGSTGNCTL